MGVADDERETTMSLRIRPVVFACTVVAAASLASASEPQLWSSGAQDPSLVGRPSADAPDACAALPLEWRLRCYGGPVHGVGDIGAPQDVAPADPDSTQALPADGQWQALSGPRVGAGDEPAVPADASLGEPQ